MTDALVCDGGVWDLSGPTPACTGTLVSVPVEDLATSAGLLTEETWEAFYPWALLMFAMAFGFRLIRRAIYSRG